MAVSPFDGRQKIASALSKARKIAWVITKNAATYAVSQRFGPFAAAAFLTFLDTTSEAVADRLKREAKRSPSPQTPIPERPLPQRDSEIRLLFDATTLRSAGYSMIDQVRRLGLGRATDDIGYSAQGQIKRLGLDQQNIRQFLQDLALYNLRYLRDEQAANDCISLMSLERYEFFDSPKAVLFEETKAIIKRTRSLQFFMPMVLQREADLQLRTRKDKTEVFDSFGQVGDMFKFYGDTHGLYDCLWRQSHAYFDKGDLSTARRLLRESYEGVVSSNYYNERRITARPPNDRDGVEKIANVARSTALIHIAEGNLMRAEHLLGHASMIYEKTGNMHGLANTFRTRAMLERKQGIERYHEATAWMYAAQRKFKSVGDQFAADECQRIIMDGFESLAIKE